METLAKRLIDRNAVESLEAIEGLCLQFLVNDWASFAKWVAIGVRKCKDLEQEHSSEFIWMYFDYSFRALENNANLLKLSGGLTAISSPVLDLDLVQLEGEPYAPIPVGSYFYALYHLDRVMTRIKVLTILQHSNSDLEVANALRLRILESCNLLFDENSNAAGGIRSSAKKVKESCSRPFESLPDVRDWNELASSVGVIPPSIKKLRKVLPKNAELENQGVYQLLLQGIHDATVAGEGSNATKILHLLGAVSAWHRDEIKGSLEHLNAIEKDTSRDDVVMRIKLLYIYAKVYAKMIAMHPLGSPERQANKKLMCETMATIFRLIKEDPSLEDQVKDDEALLPMGRRLRMVFNVGHG